MTKWCNEVAVKSKESRHKMIQWFRTKYLPVLLFFITFGIRKPKR